MRYLEKLKESSDKKVATARKLERGARAGTTPKGRAYKAAWKAADSIVRGRTKGVAKSVSSLIKERNPKKLGEAYKLIGLALIEAKADDGLTPEQKIQIRVRRANDAPDELKQKTRKGPVGDMARSKGVRQARVTSARDTRVNHPKEAEGKKFAKNREQEAVLKNLKTTNKFYKVPVKKKKGRKGK